ncbi:MAG: Tryptophan RNA-binding attenuator protein inhibitory protein, partial [Firmicutes bacterium]|nr:Tryptophan RNA-binding attenuator protein inhibitory protein [Bacillota bacterium]
MKTNLTLEETCSNCKGSGKIGTHPCPTCQGTGTILNEEGQKILA